MRIIMAATPALGHVIPMLGIARILLSEGHEVVASTASAYQDRVKSVGAEFWPLPESADHDAQAKLPELKTLPPGFEWLRAAMCGLINEIPAQYMGLQQMLQEAPADIVIADDQFFGVLPMLLGARSARPPVVLFGTTILHWHREDGAPNFLGLHPAISQAQHEEYAAITREYDNIVRYPVTRYLDRCLEGVGAGPLSKPLLESVVELTDAYMQLSVPSFEFTHAVPPSVQFVGALPIIPNQAPLPPWADDLDGRRKVILVTQGTLANHDFNLLITPTLAALADEPDLLVVVTTGGRPIEVIPRPIPANARLASYLPFEWILSKADVFVTNGGYGSVNQAMSFGIPLVAAGLTEDKADVNARVAWSGVGVNLATNTPTPVALRNAIRAVLDDAQSYRQHASLIAKEFAAIDTRAEVLRVVGQVAQRLEGVHTHQSRELSLSSWPYFGVNDSIYLDNTQEYKIRS
ncbi:UDP-glucosyltransferase [Phyllobacterium phragmitis]|uniref:UDP-glucosyltransferase n=2 Tax=Phyllobacterium phragmitis TaxID=2670329 RepID=A0A2S9IJJ2_9HYPH|nr:glycosyltransferase [Phyllobacterium phragmitis]PRD40701.1 UDP-glucosyltransferase [Phyllobacterium phragmitis]